MPVYLLIYYLIVGYASILTKTKRVYFGNEISFVKDYKTARVYL